MQNGVLILFLRRQTDRNNAHRAYATPNLQKTKLSNNKQTVDPKGIEPSSSGCRPEIIPLYHRPISNSPSYGIWTHDLPADNRASTPDWTDEGNKNKKTHSGRAWVGFYLYSRKPVQAINTWTGVQMLGSITFAAFHTCDDRWPCGGGSNSRYMVYGEHKNFLTIFCGTRRSYRYRRDSLRKVHTNFSFFFSTSRL